MRISTTAKLMLFVLVLALVFMLTSCGPGYHLRKAKRELAKAGELGAKFTKDTIAGEIINPASQSDTTVKLKSFVALTSLGLSIVIAGHPDTTATFDATMGDQVLVAILKKGLTIKTGRYTTKTKYDSATRTVKQEITEAPEKIKTTVEIDNFVEEPPNNARQNLKWISVIGLLILLIIIALKWRKK